MPNGASAPVVAPNLAWVHGQRSVDAGRRSRMTWQEALFRRLTGQLTGMVPGAHTELAESTLGIGPHVYYFVGRTIPDFGAHLVACLVSGGAPADHTLVSPFDTGALASGWILPAPPLDPAALARLVTENSFSLGDFADKMDRWLTTAYSSAEKYVDGKKPSVWFVSHLYPAPGSDSRVWSWEGRVQARDYPAPPIDPVLILFAPDERAAYLDWVSARGYPSDFTIDHIRSIYALSKESDTPVRDMIDFLRGRL